jgi:hypothetical protein
MRGPRFTSVTATETSRVFCKDRSVNAVRDKIVVCSENRSKHINTHTFRGKNTEYFNFEASGTYTV